MFGTSKLTVSTVHAGITGSLGISFGAFFFLLVDLAVSVEDNFELRLALLPVDRAAEAILPVSSESLAMIVLKFLITLYQRVRMRSQHSNMFSF